MEGSSSGGPSPAIEIDKHYVFNTSLLQLQLEGPFIPGSDPPCSHCKSKRLKCICEAVKQVGRAPGYGAPELLAVQERLERSREALSAIPIEDWKRHTNKIDVLKQVIPTIKQKVHDSHGHFPELLINSWTKLYEILAKTPVLKAKLQQQQQQQRQPAVVKSVHLCECPGGFIAATNHFIKTQARGALHSWRATSLNPYFEGCSPMEALDDDGVYRHTERRWISSPDGSGDLRSKSSIEFIWKQLTRQIHQGVPPFGLLYYLLQADLVTADGSFDVQYDPGRQEELVAPLVYAEVVATLGLLQLGGSAVIKAYALHTHQSVSVLALLSMCFKTVAVVKPLMSRGGNSEVYLLGIGFRGIRSPLLRALSTAVDTFTDNNAIIPRDWLPDEFLAECRACAHHFTELQAEHLEASLARFNAVSSHELWQLSIEKEKTAVEFIQSTNLLPIRFEDRIVPDKEFVIDLEKHGFTNSTRRGSRERVQGVLAQRAKFREVYMQLQKQRQEQWEQQGGCSRALCLLTPQAAVDALMKCTYLPFEEAKAAGANGSDDAASTQTALRDFFSFDDNGDNKELPVKDGQPLWFCLYAEEPPPQQQQQQEEQKQQQEAPDVASFFSSFAARARQGWHEQKQQQPPQQPSQQQLVQQKRPTPLPSAAAAAWRDEVLQALRKGEYNARPSVWIAPFRAVEPYRIQTTRFADDRLMAVVQELRNQLPFLFPMSTADLLLWEGIPIAYAGERLRGDELPSCRSIDLLLALKQLGAVVAGGGSEGPPTSGAASPEKELAGMWRKQYSVCVEISTWATPLALPLQLMLRRYGCGCLVVLNPLPQQQQLRREDLEAATPRSGPVVAVREIHVLDAFAAGEPAEAIKRQIQELVLPKLPPEGAPLVSLDITGVQHWRRVAAADRDREGERDRGGDSEKEGDREKNSEKGGGRWSDRDGWKQEAIHQKGVLAAVHSEIAQAEMEAGLVLLAQLIQGLLVLRPGGDLVLRLHSAYTRYTASLLLLASLCFCSSSLFRPPSMPCWSSDAFFIGRGRRQLETGFVLQVLCTAWNALVAANRKERSGDAPSNTHHSEAIIDFGGVTAEWTLQQCMKAKLFTDLVANRWLLSFNNYVLRQQEKDLTERLDILCAACRVAAASDGPLGPKTRGAAAAALRFPNQQERRRRVAVFLKEQGILDLMLRKDSPYHLSLSATEGPAKGNDEAEDEWGGVVFDSVDTLSIIAGARVKLDAEAGEDIWSAA